MFKEVILVPKGKNPLYVLSAMGTQTANAWIFLHKNAVEKLRSTADIITDTTSSLKLHWKATATTILLKGKTKWYKVCNIRADDIAFKHESSDPDHVFFLQMEE